MGFDGLWSVPRPDESHSRVTHGRGSSHGAISGWQVSLDGDSGTDSPEPSWCERSGAAGTAGRRGRRSRGRRPRGLAAIVVFGESARIESGAPQVLQDSVHDLVVENEGEDLHGSTATGTSEGIDLEDAQQELGPAPASCLQGGPGGEIRLAFLGDGAGVGENAEAAPVGPAAD